LNPKNIGLWNRLFENGLYANQDFFGKLQSEEEFWYLAILLHMDSLP
jgi:hypothetical protein